jgi:hypothetical protein
LCEVIGMKSERFLSELQRTCRDNGIGDFRVVRRRGKGSHVKVWAQRPRDPPSRAGRPIYIEVVLKQLGLPKDII